MAQVNPSNAAGGSYSDYPSFNTAKDLIPTILQDTTIFPTSRNIVVSGFSLGGTKAIYSHYYNHASIVNTIVFNPWIGE